MKFLIDNQLPVAPARWLSGRGCDAVHVQDRGQGQTADLRLWRECLEEERIMVSKDEDFFIFATRPGDSGRLLWLRLRNCRIPALLAALDQAWLAIETAFQTGQQIVELR